MRHKLSEFSGSIHSFSGAALTAPANAGEGDQMKQNKNLRFCMDELQSMRDRDGCEPEQRSALEKAREKLRRLSRNPNPSREEIFEVVRQVAEAISKSFVR
jgi:hypothetical protein